MWDCIPPMGTMPPRNASSPGLTASSSGILGDNFCPDDQAQLERERNRLVDFVGQLRGMDEFFLW